MKVVNSLLKNRRFETILSNYYSVSSVLLVNYPSYEQRRFFSDEVSEKTNKRINDMVDNLFNTSKDLPKITEKESDVISNKPILKNLVLNPSKTNNEWAKLFSETQKLIGNVSNNKEKAKLVRQKDFLYRYLLLFV